MEMKENTEKTLKEIWEREKGIKSAFYNACQMFLMLSQNEEENDRYLDLLWGGIVGVLSASAINEYAELQANVYGGEIEVTAFDMETRKEYVIDSFKRGDKWVDVYKNGTAQYWEMDRY
jgi:hypothetical protein